jgi:hypothetical protein
MIPPSMQGADRTYDARKYLRSQPLLAHRYGGSIGGLRPELGHCGPIAWGFGSVAPRHGARTAREDKLAISADERRALRYAVHTHTTRRIRLVVNRALFGALGPFSGGVFTSGNW